MKRKSLVFVLSGFLSLVNVASGAERDGLTCCLADEWIAEDTVTELQQISPAATIHDLTCCLASEWTAPDETVVAVDSGVSNGHAADGFCCIADEWKL